MLIRLVSVRMGRRLAVLGLITALTISACGGGSDLAQPTQVDEPAASVTLIIPDQEERLGRKLALKFLL